MEIRAVGERMLVLLVSLIPLAACGTSEARSGHAQSEVNNRANMVPDTRDAPQPKQQLTGLNVALRRPPDDWCGSLETMRLVVLDGPRQIAYRDYCSAYNIGGTLLVTDARGGHYVLLTYGEGHGTHATSYWLRIFRLDENYLVERSNFQITEPLGSTDHVYVYRTETPPGGGLIVRGSWVVDDPRSSPPDLVVPERSRTVIELDTPAQEERR
jgi:hypothetical protein